MTEDASAELLVLVVENTELRVQLADLQEQLVEVAVDAGDLHVQVQHLQKRLAAVEHECDLWRQEAERLRASAA